ncbi:putative effector of murein hydrolase [Bradyrhizobium sp. USDA 3311]
MNDNPHSLWVYLSQSPLLWLTATLPVYAITDALSLATHRHPLANPVLHAMWIISLFLLLTGTSYTTYFAGAQFVHFLLGPATVALAVPLYQNRKLVTAAIVPLLAALVVGSITAVTSVVLLAEAARLPREIILSLAPKSVTAGVAMGISEALLSAPGLRGAAPASRSPPLGYDGLPLDAS